MRLPCVDENFEKTVFRCWQSTKKKKKLKRWRFLPSRKKGRVTHQEFGGGTNLCSTHVHSTKAMLAHRIYFTDLADERCDERWQVCWPATARPSGSPSVPQGCRPVWHAWLDRLQLLKAFISKKKCTIGMLHINRFFSPACPCMRNVYCMYFLFIRGFLETR